MNIIEKNTMKKENLLFLIEKFLSHLNEKSKIWKTPYAYEIGKRWLNEFLKWCIDENLLED